MVTNFVAFYACEITFFSSIENIYCLNFMLFYVKQKIYVTLGRLSFYLISKIS